MDNLKKLSVKNKEKHDKITETSTCYSKEETCYHVHLNLSNSPEMRTIPSYYSLNTVSGQ